jgi:hypothetical protein
MNSIAAAKRRRAGIQPTTPQPQTNIPLQTTSAQQPQSAQPRMNIVQYLASLEKRVVTLESQKPDVKPEDETLDNIQVEVETPEGKTHIPIVTFMESMDARFQMLVDEIASLKDTVMKLQTFTMEVNQKLFHELTTQPVVQDEQINENTDVLDETGNWESTLTVDTNIIEDVSGNIEAENENDMMADASGNSETDDIQIGYRQDQKKKRKNK